MKKILFLQSVLLLNIYAFPQSFITAGGQALAVVPSHTSNVEKCVSSLNGVWEFISDPGAELWKTGKGDWKKIQVPGEPAMQGFGIVNDKEFFYRTHIEIPVAARDKSVILRFNGVYSYARVFVNGVLIREHVGGFTAWDADITAQVAPGKPVTVYVGVSDKADDISYASGYAHHPIAGILREVKMLVLPKDYINRFYVQTNLSGNLKNTVLSFSIAKKYANGNGKIALQLQDRNGKPVLEQSKVFDFSNSGEINFTINISNPVLWNEEQPYLYTIKATLLQDGLPAEKIEQAIGIRNVQVDGKKLLVNGMPVKLRGACRHDVHPLLGRSTSRYYDSLDVVLAKEANVNFIRTSHYPPSPDFLEFADKYGLYVEEETAICFVNDWREGVYKKFGETNNDSNYTSRYLGQLSEMIDRDRNHASIIIWSIGNESNYGINFQKEYDFIKMADGSRPVSWSWPGTAISLGKQCFDIAIAHYPEYHGREESNFGLKYKNMEHESLPLLSDEWNHVPCYNVTLLSQDPNVKDFWGRSLDSMWANRFDIPGNLGGAIWGMTDETFFLPDGVTGYGPWGFIDSWRRKKTEFWNTRKAYSPVRVLKTSFTAADLKQGLKIPVKNRFNHLLLNQLILKVTVNGKTFINPLPALKPHEEGLIPIKNAVYHSPLLLQFFDKEKRLIDEERISWINPARDSELVHTGTWKKSALGDSIILKSNQIQLVLLKQTGLLLSAKINNSIVLEAAPRFLLYKPVQPDAFKESTGIVSGTFQVASATIDTSKMNCVKVSSSGTVDKYPLILTTEYYADGTIRVHYSADSIPPFTWQMGLAFPVSNEIDAISWNRKGYWTTYPVEHLSALKGRANRYTENAEQYRVQPHFPVAQGMNDYYLRNSIMPEIANMNGSEGYRATKENIYTMDLINKTPVITVISNGSQAAKMQLIDSKQELLIVDKLDYWTLSWGNFAGTANAVTKFSGTATLQLLQQKNIK